MYKAFTALWCKSPAPLTSSMNRTRMSSDTSIDEDGWILVSDTASKTTSSDDKNSIMTNSWIASPPLVTRDESPVRTQVLTPNIHQFNPIENLLIEHASMSVYEQIASRSRPRRQRKLLDDAKLDEQTDDDDDQESVVLQYASQHPNATSIDHRTANASLSRSTNSSVSTMESSTSSLVAHHRHLNRIHQRRRRRGSGKTTSKLLLTGNTDESKATFNKIIERQRLNSARTPKLVLHQPSRSNH